jgi:hypothetical protein
MSANDDLPIEIKAEAGTFIAALQVEGWFLVAFRYDAKVFGNWYVDLRQGNDTIRLIKDRLQYMLDGPPKKVLEIAGLWRAFDDLEEFHRVVMTWARDPNR